MQPFLIPKITQPFDFGLALPGSKSIALRQMAVCALAQGTSTLMGVPPCDDIFAMIDCLRALGVTVLARDAGTTLDVTGPMNLTQDVALNARMSGASTRLLIGLAACRTGRTSIDGHQSLRLRTNKPLLDVLAACGCLVESKEGGLPTTIRGPITLRKQVEVDGSISSQYITALLIIAPWSGHSHEVHITGSLVSRPYIDITIAQMAKRGIEVKWLSDRTLVVAAGQYSVADIFIEGDATAASYFAALATLHGSVVTLTNLNSDTHQGDYAFMDVMQKLGATIKSEGASTQVRGADQLAELNHIDMTSMPDAALTLIAIAPLIPGRTEITGLSTLHHKECDRLICAATEMQAMGIETAITDDSIAVADHRHLHITPHTLRTYHDHRMAMAFSTLASVTGHLTVDDMPVVAKTYPNYWQDYARAIG